VCLEGDALHQERDALRQALAEQTALADLGTLAGPLAHEVNNFLNVALLQTAVMEQGAPEPWRADLASLRQQGKTMAALVKLWQQQQRRQQGGPPSADLNQCVRDALHELEGPAAWTTPRNVQLDLARDLPPVAGHRNDLVRLVRFLVTSAAAVAHRITVRTLPADEKIFLRVEDDRPAVAPDELPRIFNVLADGRVATNRLELAACHRIVRRHLQGQITAENLARGGVALHVVLRRWQ
jgi:signal transduction histidine kinase